jgi:hypothetical protein
MQHIENKNQMTNQTLSIVRLNENGTANPTSKQRLSLWVNE